MVCLEVDQMSWIKFLSLDRKLNGPLSVNVGARIGGSFLPQAGEQRGHVGGLVMEFGVLLLAATLHFAAGAQVN